MSFYHDGSRSLQDRFDGRQLADSLDRNRRHSVFTNDDRKFIENASFFFLATTSGNVVDCSFKGGIPGFIRITGSNSLAFPDYDGNSMYRSLGNILENENVGLLFLNFDGGKERMRINGTAKLNHDEERLREFDGAKLVVDVTATNIFPNCPRYIPQLQNLVISDHAPNRAIYRPKQSGNLEIMLNHTCPDLKERGFLMKITSWFLIEAGSQTRLGHPQCFLRPFFLLANTV